jgi:hypothetical protein
MACASWWSLNVRSRRSSLSGIHMRLSYSSTLLFSLHSPSAIFPSWVVSFAFFLWISWISLSTSLSVWILLRSSLSIFRLMVSVVLVWSVLKALLIWGASKASLGSRIQPWFCRCFISPSQGESPDSLERISGLPASFLGRYLIVKS